LPFLFIWLAGYGYGRKQGKPGIGFSIRIWGL